LQAIEGRRDKVQIATKFGITKFDNFGAQVRGDAEYVRSACEASLQRLNVDYIDLYYQHRVDTTTPIEITVRNPRLPQHRRCLKDFFHFLFSLDSNLCLVDSLSISLPKTCKIHNLAAISA
jgi:diketogulonate reductase-like aldo/keto reductase